MFHQLIADLSGTFEHRIRNTGQFGHLDAITLIRTALDDLAQEDNIFPGFFDGDTVVVHTVQFSFQFRQFMVMCCKQCLGPEQSGIGNVFYHGPGNAETVEGTGAAPDLIQDDQTVSGGIAKDVGNLCHLYHKSTLAAGQIVGSTDTGKDPVHQSDVCLPGRHKGTNLRHQHDQSRLPHVGGLAGHIRPGDDTDPVILLIQIRVIGHKHIMCDHLLHHRMPALFDPDLSIRRNLRADKIASLCHHGKRCQHIDLANDLGSLLHADQLIIYGIPDLTEQIVF